ncbi:MAG: sulfatase [Deltaproteobacteria bacterium]|nr:sulfatase [Deltaproteobacteria bacterium]
MQRTRLSLVLNALAAAAACCTLWGAYEVTATGIGSARGWAAASVAATVPAFVALVLMPVGLRVAEQSLRLGHGIWILLRASATFAPSGAACLAISAAATVLVPRLSRLEAAAQAAGAGIGLLLLVVLAWALRFVFRKLRQPAKAWGAVIVLLLWLVLLWPDVSLTLYYLNLGWLPESLAVTVCVWMLAHLAGRSRWSKGTVFALALVFVGLAAFHVRTPLPNKLTTAFLRQRELTSKWLPLITRRPAQHTWPSNINTCHPGVAPPATLGPAPADAPDIIFITIDGVGWDHTSFADPSTNNTPALAKHAQRAAVFSRAYTPATWTRQAFRAIFTGLDASLPAAPAATKWGLSFALEQKTLTTYLHDAGYDTIAVVSEPRIFSSEHNALLGFTRKLTSSTKFVKQHHYETNYKINEIIGHMLPLPNSAPPRFVWTHILDTHYPYSVGPGTSVDKLTERERHAQSLRFVDGELGRLLDFVASPDRREKTWVFITADHGEAFLQHKNPRHGWTVYEEELHVPLLVWGPGVVPGRYDDIVSNVSLMPTMLQAAGLPLPGHVCGPSLLPLLQTGEHPTPAPVIASTLPDDTTDAHKIAWFEGARKLIWSPETNALELYDLRTDPAEKNNLADTQPTDAEAMLERLKMYWRSQGRAAGH